MRGLAAVGVMLFHFRYSLPSVAGIRFFESGNMAVDMFFVLSGFVISISYDHKIAVGLTTMRFARMRLIRLLPMIWVGILIGAALLLAQSVMVEKVLVAIIINGLLLPVPTSPMWPNNAVEWSLFYEMLGNIFLVATYRYFKRRTILVLIGVSGLALTACTLTAGRIYHESSWFFVLFGSARVGYSFFLGVFLARTRGQWSPRLPQVPAKIVLMATAGTLCVPIEGNMRAFSDLFIAAVVCPILVMLGSTAKSGKLYAAMAAVAGEMSYPLYAIHYPVHGWVDRMYAGLDFKLWVASTLACLTLLPVSYLLGRYYDRRMQRYLRTIMG